MDSENGVKRWRLIMEAIVSTVAVIGIVFMVLTQAGWVMTRDAHAQDVEKVREIADEDRAYAQENRTYLRFLACVQFYDDNTCRQAYRGVIDLDELLEPR